VAGRVFHVIDRYAPDSATTDRATGVPTADGGPRKLGKGVTNVPGGWVTSANSRWVLYLAGWMLLAMIGYFGTLHALRLPWSRLRAPEA
jgi:hypothetical protein